MKCTQNNNLLKKYHAMTNLYLPLNTMFLTFLLLMQKYVPSLQDYILISCILLKYVTENVLLVSDALDQLGLKRYCCRRMLLSHVDLIEKLLNYTPLEKS